MKRGIAVVVAAVAVLFGTADPSGAWGDEDNKRKKERRECEDSSSCKRPGEDCRNAKEQCSDDDLNIDIDDIYICAVPDSCPRDEVPPPEEEEDEDEYADEKQPAEEEPPPPAPEEEEEDEDEYADEQG